MLTLGISSATKIISVGIVDEDKVIFDYSAAGDEIRSEDLTSLIDELLKKAALTIKDIQALAVAQGPGSYAGLRGGITTAKTLAQVLGVPLAGVSTLEAMAFNMIGTAGLALTILDAKSDEYNIALFGFDRGDVSRKTNDFVISAGQLIKYLSQSSKEISIITPVKEFRQSALSMGFRLLPLERSLPLGIYVARLGEQQIKSGKADSFFSLAPKYSHKPNIREYTQK